MLPTKGPPNQGEKRVLFRGHVHLSQEVICPFRITQRVSSKCYVKAFTQHDHPYGGRGSTLHASGSCQTCLLCCQW